MHTGPVLQHGRSSTPEASASPIMEMIPKGSQSHFDSRRHVEPTSFSTDGGSAYTRTVVDNGGSIMPGHRRYVQYALEAVDARTAGLYCLWDGERLTAPGHILPVEGPVVSSPFLLLSSCCNKLVGLMCT